MPIRPSQFYASLVLLVCLGTNIAFFPEVREPFLGSGDPFGSLKSALAELDINAKIAEFYPQTQSNVEHTQDSHSTAPSPPSSPPPPPPPPPPPQPVPEPEPETEPAENNLVLDPAPYQRATPPPSVEPQPEPKKVPEVPEKPQEPETPPPAAAIPQPAVATIQPVVAEQFKPITPSPKPAPPKPADITQFSASPVWGTIDTVLERPIRYD